MVIIPKINNVSDLETKLKKLANNGLKKERAQKTKANNRTVPQTKIPAVVGVPSFFSCMAVKMGALASRWIC